VSLKRV